MKPLLVSLAAGLAVASCVAACHEPVPDSAHAPAGKWALFDYLQQPDATLIAYAPTQYDPRQGAKHRLPAKNSIHADLEAVRPAFNGLILYGCDPAIAPIVLAEALRLEYKAVLLGIWDPKSAQEIGEAAKLVQGYHKRLALGVVIGNEGLNFNRYAADDLSAARDALFAALGPDVRVPIATSEPLGQYGQAFLRDFGDFLCPNIHPVFDRGDAGPVEAALWARARGLALAESLGKPCLVKETGFPHGGNARFDAESQATFWRVYRRQGNLAAIAGKPELWVSYAAAFEAFDQPFKAEESGSAVEGAWGLLSDLRKPTPAFEVWRHTIPTSSVSLADRREEIRRFLCQEMDRWAGGTVVYDDYMSGGAGFHPVNWVHASDLSLDDACVESPAGGLSCLRIAYRPQKKLAGAAIIWAYPPLEDGNWGAAPGRNLRGATRLRGQIRGQSGGECVTLSIGGINRAPHHDPNKPYQDRFGPIEKELRLTRQWQPFVIEIPPATRLESVIGGFGIAFSALALENRDEMVVYLDELAYDNAEPTATRFIRSYVPSAQRGDDSIRNACFVYDNALALLALLALGDEDSHRRARILADAFVWAQTHDRAGQSNPGPWRNAYLTALVDPATNTAILPGIYARNERKMREDRYCVSRGDTGNQAWVILSLMAAHRLLKPEGDDTVYLRAALRAGSWVEKHCRVEDPLGGYSGGFEGWDATPANPAGQQKLLWRSTEHCIDLAVAFAKLAAATGDETWTQRSNHAKRFVAAMWNAEQGHFWTGTADPSGTLNKQAIPADAQTWALLALGHDREFRKAVGWGEFSAFPRPLEWVERQCVEPADRSTLFRFSAQGSKVWPEGCAHVAACYRYAGQGAMAERILQLVAALRSNDDSSPAARAGIVPRSAVGVPAAWPEDADTGFTKEFVPGRIEPWRYPRRQHLGASAFFLIVAAGHNPYWLESAARGQGPNP